MKIFHWATNSKFVLCTTPRLLPLQNLPKANNIVLQYKDNVLYIHWEECLRFSSFASSGATSKSTQHTNCTMPPPTMRARREQHRAKNSSSSQYRKRSGIEVTNPRIKIMFLSYVEAAKNPATNREHGNKPLWSESAECVFPRWKTKLQRSNALFCKKVIAPTTNCNWLRCFWNVLLTSQM